MRILYAVDQSDGALAGADLLTELPLWETTLSVLHVVPEGQPAEADPVLARSRERLSHSTATLETQVRHGHAAQEILHAAEEHPTDLIVLGASGHSGLARFVVGSVTERVCRHAHCSVLVARPLRAGSRRVLVGIDASEGSAEAVRWLGRLPLPPEYEVRLISVLPNLWMVAQEHFAVTPPLAPEGTTLDAWMREGAEKRLAELGLALREAGKPAVTEVRSGDAAAVLLDAAVDEGASLVVVGSHGAGAVERFLLGSVSERLLRHAPCSVLVVKRPN